MLRSCLTGARRPLAGAMGASFVRQLAFLAIPYVLGRAVEAGIVAGDADALLRWCGLLALAVVVEFVGLCGWIWWANLSEARLAAGLRESLLDVVLTARSDQLGTVTDGHGDLTSRAIDDVDTILIWVNGLATWVVIATTVVVLVPSIAAMDPLLLLVALGCAAVLAVVNVAVPPRFRRRMAALARSQGHRSQAVSELLSAAATIRGLGSETALVERHHARSRRLTETVLAAARMRAGWMSSSEAIPQLGIAVGLGVGVYAALAGSLDVGQLTTFALWMGTVQRATMATTARLGDWGAAKASAQRLAEVFALQPSELSAPMGARALTHADRSASWVVDRLAVERAATTIGPLSMTVCRGEWGVLVGPTGAGKSSLLAAVAGLVPATGRVRVGDLDLTDQPTEHRAQLLGLVTQRPLLLYGTIRDNLLIAAQYGEPDPDDAQLLEYCRVAVFDEVLSGLPDGLDTVVGERGTTLSGGQRARLALARVLLRPGPVLLLDDVTSALDPDTEAELLHRLRVATTDRIVLAASHREAVRAAADHVVTLEAVRA